MAIPTNRTELKDYCLRRCGAPVIDINVADEQVEDAVDDAIDFFQEYHFDGIERQYLAHEITAADKTNRYIQLSDDITSVQRVLPFSSASSVDSLFSVEYRLRFNDLRDVSSLNMADYFIAKQYLAILDDMLTPDMRIRYKRHTERLYIDDDWGRFPEGSFFLIELHQVIDPQVHTKMYGNWLLRDLAAAYVKKQWGTNLIKFAEIQLPGGTMLNGERILEEAKQEIEQLKNEFILKYQEPDDFFVA